MVERYRPGRLDAFLAIFPVAAFAVFLAVFVTALLSPFLTTFVDTDCFLAVLAMVLTAVCFFFATAAGGLAVLDLEEEDLTAAVGLAGVFFAATYFVGAF